MRQNAILCCNGLTFQYKNHQNVFSSPEHKVLRMSYCDHAVSILCVSSVFTLHPH